MIKQTKSLATLFIVSSMILLSFTAYTLHNESVSKRQDKISNTMNDDYATLWSKVDSLDRIGQSRSALEIVDKIYEKATAEENGTQIIKAVIYQGRYITEIEIEGKEKAIIRISAQVDKTTFPTQAILQSMLAEAYQRYFDDRRWSISDRSETVNFDKKDLNTWSEGDFYRESVKLYEASIARASELMEIDLKTYRELLGNYDADGAKYRPTLYDFLAHRALDYFSNEQTYLTNPADQFYVNEPIYFADAATFSTFKINTQDSTSLKLKTMLLYQDLINIHLEDADESALIDVDLKRLEFVYNNYNEAGKDDLYEATLVNMREGYADNPTSSKISYKIAKLYLTKGENYDRRKGDKHKWALKTAYDIAQKAIKLHPKSTGASNCKSIINKLERKNLEIQLEEVNIPNQPMLGLITYKNVNKVYGKIIKSSHDEVRKLQQESQDKWLKTINSNATVQTFSLDLQGSEDFREHDVEFKMDGLSPGIYYVLIADNAGFSYEKHGVAHTIIHVSNLAFANRKNDTGNEVFIITDRTTGEPLNGVTAEYYSETYNSTLKRYVKQSEGKQVSDERGFINSSVKGSYGFSVQFSKGKDTLYFYTNYSNYRYKNTISESIKPHIFLDRAIYRPGQTIYFKGLAVKYSSNSKVSTIIKNEKVLVTFYNAIYQEVERKEMTTNEFGTFHGSFVAPQDGLLGQMHINVDINGGYSSKYFQVEEYKRPKFEVTFEPTEGSFKLNENITAQGKAKAYAGNNIDGAKVEYRVVRQAYFPYWRWWYWGSNPYDTDEVTITTGKTQTNENGAFFIDFKALADQSIPKEESPFFTFTIYADVTDITGETHSSSTVVKVGYIGLEADIAVSEQVNRDEVETFKITTKNLSGVHENTAGTIKIEQLKTPESVFKSRNWSKSEFTALTKADFQKAFPNYAFEVEDLSQNWEVEKTVLTSTFDTEKSTELQLNNINNWSQGRYRLTMKTQDAFGNPIEQVKEFTLFATDQTSVPTNEAFWFDADKLYADAGDTVHIQIGSGYKKSHILFEIEQDEQILESTWIPVKGRTSIDLPIKESYRGNIHYSVMMIQNDRFYSKSKTLYVPWSNKKLKVEYMTFRDKMLPGAEEEWQIKISGADGDKVAAEMVSTMYDASLDAFAANRWSASFFGNSYQRKAIKAGHGFSSVISSLIEQNWQPAYKYARNTTYPSLNWFGLSFKKYKIYSFDAEFPSPPDDMEPTNKVQRSSAVAYSESAEADSVQVEDAEAKTDFSDIQVRTNLNETVFFYPDLMTDKEGNIIIKFKMNEALTRWKFLGFAHTPDLQHAFMEKEVVTQKDLMIVPNPPRFLREKDKIEFTAKVSNLSEKDLEGRAKLMLFDAITMQPIDDLLGNNISEVAFSAKQGQSDAVSWSLQIPDFGVNAVTYRVVAKADNFSDGEEATLPVLTNRTLVTETLPLPIRGNTKKSFAFKELKKMKRSTTLVNHEMTLEFTSNPAWYAVQSLPYLMEYPYECTEQVFSRYYANTLATSVANSSPKVKKVFDAWKNTTPDALESNLAKNEALKYALLEETPWVLAAQNEAQQKKNLGLLFDLNRMSDELEAALDKMEKRQSYSGGFPWFPGGNDSWYVTQYIVEGMGHLQYLGAIGEKSGLSSKQSAGSMIEAAVKYCDNELLSHYNDLVRRSKTYKFDLKDEHLDYMAIHYLYARSFYLDIPIPERVQVAVDYYVSQAEQYWLTKGVYSEGMIALALHRMGKTTPSNLIVKSLKERALNHKEMGMYWKYPTGYWWYQAPIETHALMIEVFDEVANDAQAVDDLKTWLLKNRQTTHWKTTKATASAVYALLRQGDNWLEETEDVTIYFGKQKFDQSNIQKEAGSGYFKYQFGKENITTDLANIKVVNPNKTPAWGAMYWQYFEDFDKVEAFEDTPLKLKKQLFKEVSTDKGLVITPLDESENLTTGDKIIVRIELRVDRDMEYVHMKDTRASGFEPINVISRYKWQDGLGYYESTRDAATDFFFSYLPKGTYVFEYPLRANLKGNFSNGITVIQCMYAPEFTAHSEGVRVTIE